MKEYQKFLEKLSENKNWIIDIETENGDRIDMSCYGKNSDEAIEDCYDQCATKGIQIHKIIDVIKD